LHYVGGIAYTTAEKIVLFKGGEADFLESETTGNITQFAF